MSIFFTQRRTNAQQGQMITLMGIMLALSVIIIGSISAEISDIDVTIPQERSKDLLSDFIHLKKAFGDALNYNIVDITYDNDITIVTAEGDLYGSSFRRPDISNAVTATAQSFRGLELLHNKVFSATYESLDYAYFTENSEHVYYARILLSLKDSTGIIIEPVVYSITFSEIPYN